MAVTLVAGYQLRYWAVYLAYNIIGKEDYSWPITDYFSTASRRL